MQIEEFQLERLQSLWENRVRYNLTESGVHPYTLRELLRPEEIEALLDVRLTYGWTDGEPQLREAIARYYPGAGPQNVLVTNGSAEANFLATWCLLEPGDEVVLMLPNYMQIWGLARSQGVEIRPFRLREDRDWAPDLEEIRSLVSSNTKMILLCSPNNPTGAVLSPEEKREIVAIAESVGATVYADEVYRGVELDGEEGPSFRDLSENAIVAAGLSKALAHPGLRIGWLVGPEDFIARAWHHNDYTTITTGILSEKVATHILEPRRRAEILERNRRMLRENLGLLEEWVASRQGEIRLVPPKAGGMAFMSYDLEINSTELATRLREEKSLLVLPGDVYGMDRYLRVGIGERRDYLRAGLDLLGEGLDEIRREAGRPRNLDGG